MGNLLSLQAVSASGDEVAPIRLPAFEAERGEVLICRF
jgi:hypothetical protein